MSCPASPRTRMRPIGPGSPMRVLPRPRTSLVGGQSFKSGRMAFTRVNHLHAELARGLEHAPRRCDNGLQRCHIVAQRLAETAPHDEVTLHIDDQEHSSLRIELQRIGFGLY